MTELAEDKVDNRQLKALLRTAWRSDLRGARNPLDTSGGRQSKIPPIVGVLIMKGLIGAFMAALTFFVADPFFTSFIVYSTMAVFLAITVLLEFSNLILSPDEYEFVATRPIGSKTFFASKLIHLLAYVNLLGMVIYLPSAVTAAVANHNLFVFFTFALGGLTAATTIGMCFVLLYTVLLRIVNRETMQRVLGYAQLILIIIIYFGYFVVPRMFGRESLALLRDFHTDWLYVVPTAWYAAIAKLPVGGISPYDLAAAVLALIVLFTVFRTSTSRLSLSYAQTLTNTIAQQEQAQTSRKRGVLSKVMLLVSNSEDRAVWSLIRKQFKYDNRFKMSVLTILPLTALYVYLGIADGEAMVNPFRLIADPEAEGMNILLYVAIAILPFMVIIGTANSESYRAAWVYYTSPANRTRIILASTRFALTYFCLPFALLLLGLFTWFFGVFLDALLHCTFIFVILMVLTKLMVLIYPRFPFSQPAKAGQRSMIFFGMVMAAMPLMIIPMIIVAKAGYGGYVGYAIWLGVALLINFILQAILQSTIPKRAAELEFTAPV